MKNQINIAELLKDCPKGTKLYSPLCGECYFDSLNMGTVICIKQNAQEITFTSGGYYMLPVFDDCECQLFPSKDQRDWSNFQRPFKDGDILISGLEGREGNPFIFKQINGFGNAECYCAINCYGELIFNSDNWTHIKGCRLATPKEKEKLFDAIKASGYHWNEETNTLKKLSKFNVGDRIRLKGSTINLISTVTKINEDGSIAVNDCSFAIKYELQDNWELVPDKFAITTLKPFDKVLVRDKCSDVWTANFYSHYDATSDRPFVCVGWSEMNEYRYCIPYEANKELLGTTNNIE